MEILLNIGVNVDETANINHQLITTQSMPEAMCESLNLNVSNKYIN